MNFLKNALLLAVPFDLVFEGNEPPNPDPNNPNPNPNPDPAAGGGGGDPKKPKLDPVTQEYVNSLVAKERREAQAKAEKKNNELIKELETQRNLASTTETDRQVLAERIEGLRAEFASKEQLTAQSNEKRIKELESQLKGKDTETSTWRNRFTETLVENSLTEAAVKGKAFNPNQVVIILKPFTKVEEILGDDNKPTGKFQTKVKLPAKDKDGKPTVLELGPTEAVKQLSEMPEEYGNLFISGAAGGLGGGSLGRGGSGGAKDMATLPTAEYIAERRKGRQTGTTRRTSG